MVVNATVFSSNAINKKNRENWDYIREQAAHLD
jgi:hypothetical protein